jgi:hypothetical protein
MTTKLILLLACIFSSSQAVSTDDVSSIAGRWRVDRVVTNGVDRQITRTAVVTFDQVSERGVLRGSVDAGNTHTFVFTVDGQRLHMACAEHQGCTATLLGLGRRVDGPPPTEAELAASEKVATEDEYLGKLFIENDAYWAPSPSGITLGFVMADTRIELSRYIAPAPPSASP